jgi:NAD(P)-dependent dehydrogenase (short-subunit alcohol dehydrogenase family)
MAGRLDGKVAIVTGGATGIGEAICKKFAREGAQVVVCGLPDDPVGEVVASIEKDGGIAVAFSGDIAEEAEAKACVAKAIDAFGKLDILVNNAGVFPANAPTEKFPLEDFDYLLRNNCRSAFLMTQFAIPELRKTKGNIVSAGSEAGMKGLHMATPYGGTKAFIHAFMQGVAMENAKYGVRANAVCPGPIDTAWTHASTGPMSKKTELSAIMSTPLGRRGTPEEVANVYAFIASDEASFCTGALYLVDGGIVTAKGPIGMEAKKAAKKAPEGELELEHQFEGLEGEDTKTIK